MAGVLALLSIGSGHAESPSTAPPDIGASKPVEELPEMVITATRMEEDPFSLPYSISTVNSLDLDRTMPRTAPEALREVPSVMLQKTAHGQGSPYLRGFTGFRTLMLVDGIRLNNSTFRDGPNQYWGTIDALSLDRIEVLRGPASVMYGSDAIGGTANAISKSRPDRGAGAGGGFDWDGRALYRFSSAEESHVGRPEFSAGYADRLGVHLGASIKEFGNLHGGRDVGWQPMTGYGEWDIDAKVDYDLTAHARLVYGHQTVRMDDAWRTHSTIYGVPWSGTTTGSDLQRLFDQGRDLDFLQYHATELEGFVEEIHLSVSRHYQGELEDRVRANQTRQVQTVDVQTLGLSAQLQSPTPVGRWVYGAEYYRDWVDSSYRGYDAAGELTTIRVQGPVADDATYDLVGVYVEDHLPLAGERLTLTIGGRFTYAQVDANQIRDPVTGGTFALSDSWDNVVGNARLVGKLDEAGRAVLFVGASQGFRAPNLSDLTRWDADWGQEIPTPGVEPEAFLSLEAGGRWRTDYFQVEAAYFHTFCDDLIVRVPTGEMDDGVPIVAKENSGEGYVHGVELTGSVKPHRDWTLWSNFTWMRGELDTPLVVGGPTVTEPFSRLMPTTVNTGLRWRHPKGRVWAEIAATFAEKQDRLAANDKLDTQRIPPGGTPGYDIYHLRAGWSPCRNAAVTAAIENFTDEDYRIHGSGLNEPGRSFILTAELRF